MSRAAALAALVGAVACAARTAPDGGTHARGAEGRYDTGRPSVGWAAVAPGGADRAWHHRENGATIYTDSNCAERFEDGPLPDLLQHATFGVATGEPLRDEALALDGRDAHLRVVNGALDGVAVKVGAVVTRQHRCVYDLLYIAPPSRFDAGWPDFQAVVDGFRVRD
jgi:hypothetical protein